MMVKDHHDHLKHYLELQLSWNEEWVNIPISDHWFTESEMELSNTGLDAVNLSDLMPNAFLTFSTPTSNATNPQSVNSPVPIRSSLLHSEHQNANLLSTDTGSRESPVDNPRSSTLPLAPLPKVACKYRGCIAQFTQQRQLKTHMQRHMRRPYVCNVGDCTAQYPHAKSLRDHKQTKHEHKRYYCDIESCGKTVAQKKNLKRHKENKHGIYASEEESRSESTSPASSRNSGAQSDTNESQTMIGLFPTP